MNTRPLGTSGRMVAGARASAWFLPLALSTLVGGIFPRSAAAGGDATLWVVRPPSDIAAFDPSDFSRSGGVRIPAAAFDEPGRLSINGAGQILVQLDANHLWLWDGATARNLPLAREFLIDKIPSRGTPSAPLRQWLLGDDGRSLYVLQAASRQEPEAGVDRTTTPLLLRVTDLSQRPHGQVFANQNKPCQSSSQLEVWLEPCPDPRLWAPGGVVKDFLVLSHWEQETHGDASSEEPPSASCRRTLYRRDPQGWRAIEIRTWGDEPLLDVGDHGSPWIQAVADEGCCGWENDSSNRTMFGSTDTSLVLFDEWSRFHNQNYDVSFFTASARIAPGSARVAYAIHATAGAAAELRVSAEGHPDTLELASIRRSLADLPLVEAYEMRPKPQFLQRLAHAELVDWTSGSEVLVVEQGQLVSIDVLTGRRRESGIAVRSAGDAFLVRRRP